MTRALLPAAVALAVVAGCGSGSGTGTADTTGVAAGGTTVAPATTASFEPATLVPLDPAAFSDPLRIDNAWFPMTPGTQLVLQGEADRGRGELAHRVEITVTDLSKVVHGVRARVVWERDFNEGVLRETELAFFAQDDAGNLWNLGEYPEEWDARRFAGAPSKAQPADGHQLKHYAPGKGPVRVEPVGGEEQETLVLTDHRTVDAATLDRVHDAALRLDERAYRFQPTIWSTTSPAARD